MALAQGSFSSLSVETNSQDSLPSGEISLETVYGSSSSSYKEAHYSVDLVPDEIYLMVAEWDTPATCELGEPGSTTQTHTIFTNDCIPAAASNIDFEPSRRTLTSGHPPVDRHHHPNSSCQRINPRQAKADQDEK